MTGSSKTAAPDRGGKAEDRQAADVPNPQRCPKIFGLGLSRTGTKSLTQALRVLGYDTIHYPCDEATYNELTHGSYSLSILEEFDGMTDITTVPFYPQLDRAYPGSRFILTARDKEAWLASMKNFWGRKVVEEGEGLKKPVKMKMRRFLRAAVYGIFHYNRERLEHVFETHRKTVVDYFAGRPESLLEMNILEGDGWEKLCPFLGVEVPAEDFPFVRNKKQIDGE